VLAVAQDAGGAETTRPWIRPTSMEDQYPQPILDLMGWDADAWRGAGPPQYPCLIDERHEVSRLYGMVNSAPGYERQMAVIDGASDLFYELWGPEFGRHARAAVGIAELPRRAVLEIMGEFELHA